MQLEREVGRVEDLLGLLEFEGFGCVRVLDRLQQRARLSATGPDHIAADLARVAQAHALAVEVGPEDVALGLGEAGSVGCWLGCGVHVAGGKTRPACEYISCSIPVAAT